MTRRTEKIEVYREADAMSIFDARPADWRWRYRATNGKILADGAEGYKSRADAVRSALRVTGLDIPTYVGRLFRLVEVHQGTIYGGELRRDYDNARRTWLYPNGRVYYFFDALITDRPYDVELVQR